MTSLSAHGTMTMLMQTVSKSQFKSQLLEYLRQVENEKKPLVITHVGKPVVKVSPYKEDPDMIFKSLDKSVLSFKDPLVPVSEKDWEELI